MILLLQAVVDPDFEIRHSELSANLNLVRCTLTERKPMGRAPSPSPLFVRVGV